MMKIAVILLGCFLLVLTYFVFSGRLNLGLSKKSSEPTVTLQTVVQNPFDKNSQYVNPFSGYKNPFDTAK